MTKFLKDLWFGKTENTKKSVDNKGNFKIFKSKAKAIWYFLKSKTYEHEINYKTYCKLFELVKQIAKHLILNIRIIFDSKIIANSFNKYFVNWTERSFEMYLKGKLMQIWKSANIYMKIISRRFHIKTPFTFEIYTREICEKFVYKHWEAIEYVKN